MSLKTCRSLRSVCSSAVALAEANAGEESAISEASRVENSVFIEPPDPRRDEASKRDGGHCSLLRLLCQRKCPLLRSRDVAAAGADLEVRIFQLNSNRVPAPIVKAGAWISEVVLLREFVGDAADRRI